MNSTMTVGKSLNTGPNHKKQNDDIYLQEDKTQEEEISKQAGIHASLAKIDNPEVFDTSAYIAKEFADVVPQITKKEIDELIPTNKLLDQGETNSRPQVFSDKSTEEEIEASLTLGLTKRALKKETEFAKVPENGETPVQASVRTILEDLIFDNKEIVIDTLFSGFSKKHKVKAKQLLRKRLREIGQDNEFTATKNGIRFRKGCELSKESIRNILLKINSKRLSTDSTQENNEAVAEILTQSEIDEIEIIGKNPQEHGIMQESDIEKLDIIFQNKTNIFRSFLKEQLKVNLEDGTIIFEEKTKEVEPKASVITTAKHLLKLEKKLSIKLDAHNYHSEDPVFANRVNKLLEEKRKEEAEAAKEKVIAFSDKGEITQFPGGPLFSKDGRRIKLDPYARVLKNNGYKLSRVDDILQPEFPEGVDAKKIETEFCAYLKEISVYKSIRGIKTKPIGVIFTEKNGKKDFKTQDYNYKNFGRMDWTLKGALNCFEEEVCEGKLGIKNIGKRLGDCITNESLQKTPFALFETFVKENKKIKPVKAIKNYGKINPKKRNFVEIMSGDNLALLKGSKPS